MPSFLEKIDFFLDLPDQVCKAIESKFRVRKFSAGEKIVEEMSEDSDVFFMISGYARIGQYTKNGHELIYGFCKKGDFFGEFAAIDNLPRSADVYALEACELASIRATDFRGVLKEFPEISLKLQQRFIGIIRKNNRRLVRRSESSQTRIFRFLADEADNITHGKQEKCFLELPTQAVLAAMLDVSRETIARTLGRLERSGIIGKKMGGIIVLNPQKLNDLSDQV